jgi:hypothetical protein
MLMHQWQCCVYMYMVSFSCLVKKVHKLVWKIQYPVVRGEGSGNIVHHSHSITALKYVHVYCIYICLGYSSIYFNDECANPHQVTVHYLDHGQQENIPISCIFEIPPAIKQIPCQVSTLFTKQGAMLASKPPVMPHISLGLAPPGGSRW